MKRIYFNRDEMRDWYSIMGFDTPEDWGSTEAQIMSKLDSIYLQWVNHIDALPDGSPAETFSGWMAQNYPSIKIYYA